MLLCVLCGGFRHTLLFRLLFVMHHRLFDEIDANGSHEQQYARQYQHVHLMSADKVEDASADECRYNLRNADGPVKQSQVSTHILARNRIGQDGERQGEHGCPGASDQQVGGKQQVFVVEEEGGYKSDATQHEAQCVGLLACLEQGAR